MSNPAGVDELLNKTFQLAYLIVGDRMTAIRIALAAMDNLKVASSVQDRRQAYLPAGRAETRAARTKVSLSEIHILQRLVYIESELYERLLEQQEGAQQQTDLLIHFIKHLVRITTKRNSFYVSLGLSRLLYNYSTAEATEIYNLVVQDPERVRDDYYYRSRKGRLMDELKERFGKLLKTYISNRREERFQAQTDSEQYAGFVKECLLRFMPWFTACVLPADADPAKNILAPLLFKGVDPDEEHAIELNRIHTLLHPACYARLVLALGFDPPDQRLEVPYFFISGSDQGPPDDRFDPAPLTEQELDAIKSSLDSKATRRRGGVGNSLRVYVDGIESARVELEREQRMQLQVAAGAEVIQVCASEASAETLLATHLLTHDETGLLPSQSATLAEGGQQVSFSVSLVNEAADEPPRGLVKIEYRETQLSRAALLALRQLKYRLTDRPIWQNSSLWKPALLLLALAACLAGWLIYWRAKDTGARQPIISKQKEAAAPSPSVEPLPAPPTPRDQRESRPPGDLVAVNPTPAEATGRTTRGPRTKTSPASLLSVKQVYVDPFGAAPLSQQVRAILIERLQASNRFTVVQNRDEADAVFKGTVTGVENGAEKASLNLQLVNIAGQVLWPRTTRKYTGLVTEVCDKLLQDLLADVQRLERKR
jgi:hypothetical protein